MSKVKLPKAITVKSIPKGLTIHGSVMRQPAFKLDPQTFVVDNERLKDMTVTDDTQLEGYKTFYNDPTTPMVYCISGNPDDSKAKYFAAFLSIHHFTTVVGANVRWVPMWGGFTNPLVDKLNEFSTKPTMLVIYNLATCATNVKLDKVRDILEAYPGIPRIVINAGEDPISFMSGRLNHEVHAVMYFSEAIAKQRIEVI